MVSWATLSVAEPPGRAEIDPVDVGTAAVVAGRRSRRVGADQVALRPGCRSPCPSKRMPDAGLAGRPDVARDHVAGAAGRPADRVVRRRPGSRRSVLPTAAEPGGVGADVVAEHDVAGRRRPRRSGRPALVLPEITLRAAAVVPPIVLPGEMTTIPLAFGLGGRAVGQRRRGNRPRSCVARRAAARKIPAPPPAPAVKPTIESPRTTLPPRRRRRQAVGPGAGRRAVDHDQRASCRRVARLRSSPSIDHRPGDRRQGRSGRSSAPRCRRC